MKHINLTLTTLLQNFPNIKHDKQVCFFQFDKDIQVSLPKVAIARFGIGNVNEYIRFSYCLRGEKRSVSICGQPEKAWLLWFSKCYGRVGESTLEKRSVYIALHWAYNWALFERRSNEMLYIEGRIGEKLDIVQSIYSSICFWLALMYKGRQKDRFVQIE